MQSASTSMNENPFGSLSQCIGIGKTIFHPYWLWHALIKTSGKHYFEKKSSPCLKNSTVLWINRTVGAEKIEHLNLKTCGSSHPMEASTMGKKLKISWTGLLRGTWPTPCIHAMGPSTITAHACPRFIVPNNMHINNFTVSTYGRADSDRNRTIKLLFGKRPRNFFLPIRLTNGCSCCKSIDFTT